MFPETAIDRWNEATAAFWERTQHQLTTSGKTAIIGAGLPISGPAQYWNAAITVGAGLSAPFLQRVPVPLGMWKPFGSKDGVSLRLTGPGTLKIGNQEAAILICYEQLLLWPMLHSAIEDPTVLVGIANETWTKETGIPAVQRACLKAWSRLFKIPLLTAVNT